jgi:hypothetical protein
MSNKNYVKIANQGCSDTKKRRNSELSLLKFFIKIETGEVLFMWKHLKMDLK